jgi:hypothetical protein
MRSIKGQRAAGKDRWKGRGVRPGVERLEEICLLASASARQDMVLRWNTMATDAVKVDFSGGTPSQPGPAMTARALAIESLAVYDAVDAIHRQYAPYLLQRRAPAGASIDAAVAKAGHDTQVAHYPKQKAALDKALRISLATIPNGTAKAEGVADGQRAARMVLKARQDDGSQIMASYESPGGPGAFTVFPGEPAAYAPSYGMVKPFVMRSVANFLAPPPPSMTSQAYADAYNEVKDLGGDGIHTPTRRTPEQTDIGIFWAYDGTNEMGTPPRLYNQVAQAVARQEGNTIVQNARMFALVNTAMADAACASWATKYTYDFWRPIRGIRQLDANGNPLDDGNPDTTADPTWTPLGAPNTNGAPGTVGFTPPFPAYDSGHATMGTALFETLKDFYGTNNVTFTFVSDELNGINRNPDGTVRPLLPRTFTSFSQAAAENAQSRIYLGIHWQFDAQEGMAQGTAVADYAFTHMLTPLSRTGVR